jgi:flagellar basal-body rod modification protein FlgD
MPAISPVNSLSSANSTELKVGKPGGQLGKDEFLKLLTTQMSSQDPLKPMDNSAMIAQLAQFSALEQMQNLNTQMSEFRREMAMGLGISLSNQNVIVDFTDGTSLQGKLDAVSWRNGKVVMDVGEKQYEMETIQSMRRADDVTP